MLAHGTFLRRGEGMPIYYWVLGVGVWDYQRGIVSERGGHMGGSFDFDFTRKWISYFFWLIFFEVVFEKGV